MTDEIKYDEYEYLIVLNDMTYEEMLFTGEARSSGYWHFDNVNTGARLVVKETELRHFVVYGPDADAPDHSGADL